MKVTSPQDALLPSPTSHPSPPPGPNPEQPSASQPLSLSPEEMPDIVESVTRLGEDLFRVTCVDGSVHELNAATLSLLPQGSAKLGTLLARERAAAKSQSRSAAQASPPPRALLRSNRQEKSRARGADKGTRPLERPPAMVCKGCDRNLASTRKEHNEGRALGICR